MIGGVMRSQEGVVRDRAGVWMRFVTSTDIDSCPWRSARVRPPEHACGSRVWRMPAQQLRLRFCSARCACGFALVVGWLSKVETLVAIAHCAARVRFTRGHGMRRYITGQRRG